MFYHNCTTRRGHIEEEQHALSYDQKLGHNIIARWADRVKADPLLVPSNTDPDQHVFQVAKDIDKVFGKMLSMRYSDRFGKMVTPVVDD